MRTLITKLDDEKSHQFDEMIREMKLSDEHEVLNTALSLLWYAYQAKKDGKDIATFDAKSDTVERIKMSPLDRIRPTLRLI